MTISTLSPRLVASPFGKDRLELPECVRPLLRQLGEFLQEFRNQEVTPAGACQFERELDERLRQVGGTLLEWTYNQLEPEEGDLPTPLCWEGEYYRRRAKSRNRSLDSLFGPIQLWRHRYEPVEPGERSVFPLEMRLGIEVERATAALAERVGQWSAQCTQQQVLKVLRQEHAVCWSAQTLRKVTQSVSAGLAKFREGAQVAKLVSLLQQAQASAGPHRPTLSVGRDGIMVPIREDTEYREGAVGTVSVQDRRGRRLGTVYLGRMPEPGQNTLSRQLTALIVGVLTLVGTGVLPRLQYVSDAGHHPVTFFKKVLKKLCAPLHPGTWLKWIIVIDYYHATTYIAKMAEALFSSASQRHAWQQKMCRWLKRKRGGVNRVLHSAAALRRRRKLSRAEQKEYRQGYGYLRKYLKYMDYASYRRQGLAIGSGVTEAAGKTVFTQRLKQSGMTWYVEGGQVIVDLRVIWLSGVWDEVHGAYLAAKAFPQTRTQRGSRQKMARIPA
jgi:hypothetical protein